MPLGQGGLYDRSRTVDRAALFLIRESFEVVAMKTCLFALVASFICACSGFTAHAAQQTHAPAPVPNGELIQESTYHLGPGDMIEVKIYGEEDLTARVRINENGTVDLPLLPGLSILTLNQSNACNRIRQAYMKDFLVDPLVSLTILEYGRSKVTILGQVRSPGVYLFPANEKLNLLQAIALAGGYTRAGEPSKITIKRVREGKENVIKLDARAMAKEEGYKVFEVDPGDVVTIGESIW